MTTPGPAGLISFDSPIDPLAFLQQLIDQYGDVVRYRTHYGPCIVFTHPDHVQAVLHRENYRRASLVKMMLGDGILASDGPRWKSQRRLMQPDFLPARVEPFVPRMARETSRLARNWQAAAAAGAKVDITSAMTLVTLRIVVDSLFSDDLPAAQAAALCQAITQTLNALGKISSTVFGAPLKFAPESNATFAASKKVIDTACYAMIAKRKASPPADRPRDLLTLLIEAKSDGAPMTDLQLRDELVTMLVGGHETTALALAWAWQELAKRPEIEAQLHEELDRVLGGRTPAMEHLEHLPSSKAIFQEAMRLYPPVWHMARVANADDVIHGHSIPRGACVLVSAWLTHRHKDFWTTPEAFDPSRFLNGAMPSHRYAYFPFGGGRHQCMGMHFAMLEGALILAQLAQQFRVRPTNSADIRPDAGITLRQSPGLLARIETRELLTAPPLAASETA